MLSMSNKLSWKLINENQVIEIERLNIMLKNRHLARSISDMGWKKILIFLEYKCNWYKKIFFQITTCFPSSKTCNNCGHKLEKLPLYIRKWYVPIATLMNARNKNAA